MDYRTWLGDRQLELAELQSMQSLDSMVYEQLVSERSNVLELLLAGETLGSKLQSLGPKTYLVPEICGLEESRLSSVMRDIFSDLLMQLVDLHRKGHRCGLIREETIVAWKKNDHSWKAQLVPDFLPSDASAKEEDFSQLSKLMSSIIYPHPIPKDLQHLLGHLDKSRFIPNDILISHHPCTWDVYDIVINTKLVYQFMKDKGIPHPDGCDFASLFGIIEDETSFDAVLKTFKGDPAKREEMTMLHFMRMTYDHGLIRPEVRVEHFFCLRPTFWTTLMESLIRNPAFNALFHPGSRRCCLPG